MYVAKVSVLLVLITLAGGALRVYGLSRGAPFHFHADEMLALRGAVLLHDAPDAAAQSAKFFVYPVLPKRMLGGLIEAYELVRHPFDLAQPEHAATLMLLGRSISAACSILMIPIAFAIGRRVAGVRAGIVSAVLVAGTVAQVTNAHYFTSDVPLAFFCALALWALVCIAQDGRPRAYVAFGLAFGAAISCKYTAAFLLLPLAIVHILSPARARGWKVWFPLGCVPIVIGLILFVTVNPLVLQYPERFHEDVLDHIVEPNFTEGGSAPIWTAQFADETVRTYWFTNLLPWNLGPALALWGFAGSAWLLMHKNRAGWAVASYSICYYLVSSQTTTPYMRYVLPLGLSFAVAAASLSVRAWRTTLGVVAITALWAIAYLGVYRDKDPRVEAAAFIERRISPGAKILVEPSHNIPPMGSYREAPQFFTEYVGWGRDTVREDGYALHTLDVYHYLYDPSVPAAEKRDYIEKRLAKVDYIVMDDTFDEFYEHLNGPEHAPVREYYRALFSGALGFRLMREFRSSPTLFGFEIPDEAAEMTFSLFDHPDVYVFRRDDPAN
jgi:hypothetical protein